MASRFVAPKQLTSLAQAQEALQRIQEQLDALTRPRRPGLVTKDTTLVAGEFVRISPRQGATLVAKLPKASAENSGERIDIALEQPSGTLRISAQRPDTVGGELNAAFDVAGLIILESNGVDQWVLINQLSTIGPSPSLVPIPDQTVLGNDTGSASLPTPVTVHQELDWIGSGSIEWIFDGVDDSVAVADVFPKERTDPFSMSFWFRTASVNGFAMGKFATVPTTRGYAAQMVSGKLRFVLSSTNTTSVIAVETASAFNDNVLRHCTMTYDGTSLAAGVKIYVNGVNQSLTVLFNNLTTTTLAASVFALGPLGAVAGYLLHLAIWGDGLSAAEALEIYGGGTPPDLNAVSCAGDLQGWWKLDAFDAVGVGGILDYGPGGANDGTAQGGFAPTSSSSVTVGVIPVRGVTLWQPLMPGAAGTVLTSTGTAALPVYAALPQVINSPPGFDGSYDQAEPMVIPGPQGLQGLPGSIGAPGLEGERGADGEPGPPGRDGAPGTIGVDGAPGRPGLDGADGLDGERGPPGQAGADGAQGVAGANGQPAVIMADIYDDGEPFVMPGPAGAAGAVGATGGAGAQGAAGPPGTELAYDQGEPFQVVYPPSGVPAESFSEITLAAVTGNLGTIDISSLKCGGALNLQTAGNFQIEGFTAKEEGFWFFVDVNNPDFTGTFMNDTVATAANRLRTTNEVDATAVAHQAFVYYREDRWRVVCGSSNIGHVVTALNLTGVSVTATSAGTILTTSAGSTIMTAGTFNLDTTNTSLDVNVNGVRIDGTSSFLTWLEKASSTLSVSAGDGMCWVLNEAPNQLMFTDDTNADWRVGYGCPAAPITANVSAAALATNLSCCTFTIPAGSLRVGSTYRYTGWWVFLHTAAATPTLTAEFLVNGAVIGAGILTPVATAGTTSGQTELVFTVRTIGAGGTLMWQILHESSVCAAGASNGSNNTATGAIDTTVARPTELRIRMTTAVAGNTLTVTNGCVERLI